jgi:hypothetical protein
MYKITINRNSSNYELIRNRDGRIMAEQPIKTASIYFSMAYHMSQHAQHASGHLWRAAEAAEAGQVELLDPIDRRHDHGYNGNIYGLRLHVATVNATTSADFTETGGSSSAST